MNDAIPRPQAKTRKALTPLLEIRNLTKSYDGQHAVDDVSLTIYKGEIFALLGASGCGKSTLLRMLAGFEQPSAGQIMLDGVDLSQVPPYLRPINMMFQSYALFPHMTVEQNIAFGLKQDKLPKAEIASRVNEMLGLVHMQEFAKRKPHQLSGGQRQRVALARSLAKRPKLLLLDEPMGALDKKLRDRMQLEVVDILERVGVTCVMVTHDQEEAMTMAGRIAIMNRGKFVQIGEPEEIYEHPTTRYSAEFIFGIKALKCRYLTILIFLKCAECIFTDKFHQRLIGRITADNLMTAVKHCLGIFADCKVYVAFYLTVTAQFIYWNGFSVRREKFHDFKTSLCNCPCLITKQNI